MPDAPRVKELLEEIFDLETTPEAVCVACPELLPVVRERWKQICRARAELDALLPVWSQGHSPRPMTEEVPLPEIPGYEVESVLGHGGMGVVFRAKHLRLGRQVALKMTRAGVYARPQEQERFRREAETVAALQHPNLVQVFDVGDWAGRPYFTMELIEGGNLAQRLVGVPQPAHQSATLIATLAEAVHAAHQGGIVHRDLKPGNILFTPNGEPKIADFGLARRLDGSSGLTLSGVPLGTPSYMAPEQARGQSRDIGPAADVYALGAILYELLTGRAPFHGETPTETLLQVIHHEPVSPVRFNAKAPRDLVSICLTCLQKEPRLRYVTAAALADDLHCFLRGESITARPEAYFMRWVRRVCRQPALAAAVAIAALSSLAFAGGGLWLLSDQSAKAQAAYEDVSDMVRHLNQSSWDEASAARDRANGRLGNNAPARLRVLIDQGGRDLELAARLNALHAKGIEAMAGGTPLANYDKEFMTAFLAANLGTFSDKPEVVAKRIKGSNIRDSLIAALDWYYLVESSKDRGRDSWALEVARIADSDQSSWRRRARDLKVLQDKTAIKDLIETRPTTDPSKIPVYALELYLSNQQLPVAERVALLKRLYQTQPGDFWLNLRLGGFLRVSKMQGESLGYLQTATALRPESAIAHFQFGNALFDVGRREEAVEQSRRAAELDPTIDEYHKIFVRRLSDLGRDDQAIKHLQRTLRGNPNSAFAHTELGLCLERQGNETEALVRLTRAVELDPTRLESQKVLRDYWLKRGKLNELQVTWQAALTRKPIEYSAWYGYAELCLFLGKEKEYLNARQELLKRFGSTTDSRIAEQVSRLSLLLPLTGNDLSTAVALAECALSSKSAKSGGFYSYFLFARGLAEYRQEKFEQAIATMKGDASRVLGPAPRLVLAMALCRHGQEDEACKTLAAAVIAHDWRSHLCKNQDAWIYHVLRREAEQMILPSLSEFLAEKYQPQDNDERFALIGVCQFSERSVALAKIYRDAFAAETTLLESASGHRYAAAKAAARAGCGRGSDVAELKDADRSQWRRIAIDWLREELDSVSKTLEKSNQQTRSQALKMLRQWQTEDDLSGLREPGALEKLLPDERKLCDELWVDVKKILARAV